MSSADAGRRWRPWRDPLWWAGTVALAGAYAWVGLRTTTFLPDEQLYVALARWLPAHLPGSLIAFAPYQRGPQRLDTFLLAPVFGLTRLPASFAAGHVLQALLFASTALPVALLGELLGLRRAARLLAAIGAIAAPAGIVAASFLPDAVAYPAFAWALWAVCRALIKPFPRHDLIALGLCVVAALCRTQLVVLLALPLGAALLAGAWREHRVLVASGAALAVAVLVALAVAGRHALLGSYAVSATGATRAHANDLALDLAHLGAEVAFVPLVLAIPWLLGASSREPVRRAFRAVALVAAALVLVSLLGAPRDERYLLYFVPIVALAAALHLEERRSWVPVALTALAIGLLVAVVGWATDSGPFERFIFPSETFLRTVVVDTVGRAGLGLAVAAAGLVAAACVRRRGGALAALIGAVAIWSVVQLAVTLDQFGRGLGRFDGASAAARGWVDQRVGSATVGALVLDPATGSAFGSAWRALVYWNGSVTRWLWIGPAQPTLPVGTAPLPVGVSGARLTVSRAGLLSAPGGVPSYVVVPEGQHAIRLHGRVVARSRRFGVGLELVRLSQPPR